MKYVDFSHASEHVLCPVCGQRTRATERCDHLLLVVNVTAQCAVDGYMANEFELVYQELSMLKAQAQDPAVFMQTQIDKVLDAYAGACDGVAQAVAVDAAGSGTEFRAFYLADSDNIARRFACSDAVGMVLRSASSSLGKR